MTEREPMIEATSADTDVTRRCAELADALIALLEEVENDGGQVVYSLAYRRARALFE